MEGKMTMRFYDVILSLHDLGNCEETSPVVKKGVLNLAYIQIVFFAALWCTFRSQPSKFFPKRIFFFLKKPAMKKNYYVFLYFRR